MVPDKIRDNPARQGGRLVAALVGAGVLAAAVAVAVYTANFRGAAIVAEPEPWGRFGDFLGGTLTPLVGLLAAAGLIWALQQIRGELAQMRAALDPVDPIALGSEEMGTGSGSAPDLRRTIELIHEDVKEQLEGRLCIVRQSDSVAVTEVPAGGLPARGAREVPLGQLLRESVQDPVLREALGDQYRTGLSQLSELFQLLARHVHDYEGDRANACLGGYLRRRHAVTAVALQKIGVLPEKVAGYYRDTRNGRSKSIGTGA